jgi:glycosyltransferase involved in cell wall biosynthesis
MALEEFVSLFKKYKVAVVVPTFNNERTVGHVIRSIQEYSQDVIVVNDGSTDSTAELLQQFQPINLVSYTPNGGKGYALRKGFQRAIELGYDYVITIDSDGQHFAEDLPKFLHALQDHPAAIIMGVRDMEQAGIPGKSSFGHKFSNFWFWVETGIKMNDTQSGYRLYPVRLIQGINFITRKFEFEIEVMVRSVWKGVAMAEVPVKVFYARKEDRVSHFRPFQDFTRISILNTVLVTIALFYIKPRDFLFGKRKGEFWSTLKKQLFHPDDSNFKKALSIGVGVFMGIVPIWGFQLIVAIGLAFAFRLNKALVIIAANISIPPMIPVILFLSHLTGALWMGDRAQYISFHDPITLEMIGNNSVQYVFGAITFAIIAGTILGTLTYLGLKIFKKPKT